MQFKGFKKNQTLREGRESKSELPPPTPAELRSYSEPTPAKEKLSKDKLNRSNSSGAGDTHTFKKIKNQAHRNESLKIPSVNEIAEYFIHKGYDRDSAFIQANKFWNFYDSKDWMIGKNKMKKWRSAVNTWIINEKSKTFKSKKTDEIKEYSDEDDKQYREAQKVWGQNPR